MDRFLLKEFAKTPTIQTGVYGSEQQGSPTYSENCDTIQSLTAWEEGIGGATDNATQQPAINDDQGVYKVLCKSIKNGQISGVPLYLATETYMTGSIVLDVNTDSFNDGYKPFLYFSLVDNNIGNPLTDTNYWRQFTRPQFDTATLFDIKYKDTTVAGFNWQEQGTTCSATDYPFAYSHLLNDYTTGTAQTDTITLPDGTTFTVNYMLANDGHKIVDIADYANIVNLHTAAGAAWYYVIDTVNQTFILPRNNYYFRSTGDVVKYFAEGLPNITGSASGFADRVSLGTNGAITISSVSGANGNVNAGTYYTKLDFDASSSNKIYGNSVHVRPISIALHLLFFVF